MDENAGLSGSPVISWREPETKVTQNNVQSNSQWREEESRDKVAESKKKLKEMEAGEIKPGIYSLRF